MKGGTLFSGIGAPEQAAPWVDWRWSAEIDPFASAVLAARHPHSRNLGDVTSLEAELEPIDLLVFGSPCQAFSVAGKRAGLDDPRGDLTLTGLAIAGRVRPRWVVWENVPGVLSIDGGRTFGAVLGILGQLGYGFAYRVLDAQHFGVPQRRRRVFAVGCLGDWRAAAAVLFERESLSGNPPPRREAGQGASSGLGDGVARCPSTSNQRIDAETETLLPVAHSLRADGFDVSEDGTGRGTPLVPVAFNARQDPCPGEVVQPLDSDGFSQAVAFQTRGSNLDVGAISGTLGTNGDRASGGAPMVAQAVSLRGREGGGTAELSDTMPAMRASQGGGDKPHVMAAVSSGHGWWDGSDVGATIRAQDSITKADTLIASPLAVRRLTPRECERLQGFPDDYTLVTYRGKPAADGPRYRALGNSMAVPVMAWILDRIRMVDAILSQRTAA